MTFSLFEIVLIAALAVYRLNGLLNAMDQEAGPAHVLDRFRTWIGVEADEKGKPTARNGFAEVFLCPLCLSVQIGIVVTLLLVAALLLNALTVAAFVLLPFALSGVAVALRKFLG